MGYYQHVGNGDIASFPTTQNQKRIIYTVREFPIHSTPR